MSEKIDLPRSVIADALAMWMAGFRETERKLIPAVMVNGGRTGLDVDLFHRVKTEEERLRAS